MRTTAPPPLSSTHAHPPDWQGISRKRLYFAIAGLQLGLLLAALDQTIVGTAMPQIVADLNGFEHYAWATTAYMLCSTAVVPIVGKLSDMYGRKIFLMGGTVFFILSSVLCGLAQDMLQLAVLRGLQGLGGGVVMSSVFTAISLLFPPAQRGKIQGVFGAVFGLASIIGPLLGGFLTDTFSWRWIFLVNVPVGLAALAVLGFAFPDWRPERRAHRIDYLGAVTLVGGIVPLLLALTWGGREFPWASPQVAGLMLFSLATLTAFVSIERRAPEAIIPLGMLRNPAILLPLLSLVFMSAGMFGTVLFVPLFIQSVVGSSATESGTALMPMMLAMVVSSIVCGHLISRTGRYKWAGLLGLGLSAAGLFLLSGMGPGTGYYTVLRNMLFIGVGMGFAMPVYTLAAQNAVTIAEIGVATALTQFFRSIGGTLGVAVLGSLLANGFTTALHKELPGQVLSQLPATLMAQIENPQALLDPKVSQSFTAGLQGASAQAVSVAMDAVRLSLADSLHTVFLAGAIIASAGVVSTLLLPETKLRSSYPPARDRAEDPASS